jgi:hypothetical protein
LVLKNGFTEAYFEAYPSLSYSYNTFLPEGIFMKNQLNHLATRIDRRHIRLAFFVLSLVLFILGAGAPEDSGGFFH